MFTSLIKPLMTWMGLKGSELLLVIMVVVAGLVVWGVTHQNRALQQEAVLTEEALQSAIDINTALKESKAIDMAVVTTWIEARDQYRQRQDRLIDTTFLDYFSLAPDPIEIPEILVEASIPPSPDPDPEIVYVPQASTPTTSMSTDKLRVLARGLRETYCTAQYDDGVQCPP